MEYVMHVNYLHKIHVKFYFETSTSANESSRCLKLGLSHICSFCCSLFPWVTPRESPVCSAWLAQLLGWRCLRLCLSVGEAQGLWPSASPVALTSAISIFPSEFLSYFCMNSFIFSPKLSLFDICGQREEADLAALLYRGEALGEAELGVISCPGHMTQEPEMPELRGSVSTLGLTHRTMKGRQDTWACSVPCDWMHPLTLETG